MFPRPPDDACGRFCRSEREVPTEFHRRAATCGEGCALVVTPARDRRRRRPGRTRPRAPARPRFGRRLGLASASGSASSSATTASISASASSCCACGLGLRGGLRLGLGRGDRVELLLWRQLAALGHDRDLERGGHVGKELDRDLVAADPLDRLGQVELAPVDADLLRLPELLGDVGRGDRAEERAGLARGDVEAQLGALEPSARSPAPARSSEPRAERASPRACAARRPWPASPSRRASAAAGSCARSRRRRPRPRRAGRSSRRPVGG